MKIDKKSLTYRLIVPLILSIIAISSALIVSINSITNHIIEEFVWNAISNHVSETMRIIELAQADLTNARLLDNPPVAEAKKRLVLEAISLNWQRRGVSGAITDENNSIIFSNLPEEIIKELFRSKSTGHLHMSVGKSELHGQMVTYPAWRWQIFVGTKTLAHDTVKGEVYYLIPVIAVCLILIIFFFIIILRRNLQIPMQSLISAIGTVKTLPQTGITELDQIGSAMNETMGKLVVRTDELATELGERIKADAALQESEERYRTTLMSVGDGVIATDDTGRVILMNKVAETLTGWLQSDAYGRPLDEVFHIVHEETRQKVENPVERVLREGIIVGLANHTVLLNKGGGECAIADAGAPIWSGDRHIRGVVLVFRDQTEERAAQDALRTEKNKSEAIIAAMGDGISIQDLNYRILYQNNVHKEFIGAHAGEYCFRAYESRENVCEGCPVALTLDDGKIHTVLRTVQLPGGTKYFEVTSSPLRDAAGLMVAGIEVVRDVTVQRHNEEQLRQAQKMEGIGQLAGGIAHDFNNILTAIVGYASLLEYKLKDDEQLKPYVSHILESTERASGLTKSLLAFSRKQPVEVKPLNLNELVCNFRGILSRLIGEDIEIVVHCSPEDMIVEGDKGQIEQILMNLATNARDAMPKGGRFEIATEKLVLERVMGDLPQGSYAVIAASDTGLGMDRSTADHIFEPFFTTKDVGKGTGLGLAIAYGIIIKHRGTIHVYSELGQGTTFRIYLPLAPSSMVVSLEHSEGPLPAGTETILLVEDNDDTRTVTRMILEEFGYTVFEAVDGEDAIAVFRNNQKKINLVLSDLVMPKKNGREACAEMKKIMPDIKIILMSGYTADIISQKGVLEEGINFMSKPLNPSTLLQKIRSVLSS